MILLDYIPHMILVMVLGAFSALVAKVIYEHRGARLSFIFSFCGFVFFIFPVVLYKAIKKHRTSLIQQVNKNTSLSDEQKKAARRIISTDSKLFFFILKFTLVNYRMILKIFTEVNLKKLIREKEKVKMVETRENFRYEAETALLKDLTKPLESYISRSLA
ncbi:hypothetical protein [Bacillus infantis]|uniref:hypothetical protein n=1 Tax=Bacillus infantis TaxID=324767 RepID=UPI003CEFBAF1